MTTNDNPRPVFPKRAVVTSGMPYGNKGLHFGHIAGVFVPADIFARFLRDRIGSRNVLYVSGTDCYGSPIEEGYRKQVEAGFQGSIEDYVGMNHDAQKKALDDYLISLDIYEGSALGEAKGFHRETTDWIMNRLYENGFLDKIETAQFYDPIRKTFLNGRQVVGHCPVQGCKSEKGYADECDLGHQYMPEDLIDPKSTLTGETPEMRPVVNWYFRLPAYLDWLRVLADHEAAQPNVRPVVATTTREFLGTPVIYIKNELEPQYREWADELPNHEFIPAEKGKQSFALEFADISTRDAARDFLAAKGVRLRTGKALVPVRLTGNIKWGVPAPVFEGVDDLTIWVWPESLWAPISFSKTALAQHARAGHPKASNDWRDWWCNPEAEIFQFIGQDNIYFYGIAQPAMWDASRVPGADDNLQQSTLIANYHVLFMNKKASSSGAVKPPMAAQLLDHYTPEQLRAHFFALGLGQKSVSFAPKPYDPDTKDNPKAADPVLKPGCVVIKVRAAGVNRADLLQAAGKYPPPPGWPDWPGLECSGVIEAAPAGSRWQLEYA
ncbi:MAG: class I tRNA ligase family protein, partial [Coriobacteriales bacterium]|nr:class I tRNA ligase family protein [Coriobacteriales bacterium]